MARLTCTACSLTSRIDSSYWRCPSCGGTLRVFREGGPRSLRALIKKGVRGMWRYRGWLPFSSKPVTLGEGETPLIRAEQGGTDLLLKLEYVSPTGSFKDRGASMSLTRAAAIGAERVVEDSTGNAGVAASAYAARAGIKARIYVPSDAPEGKKFLIRAFGAEVVECSSRAEAAERAISELGRGDLYIGHAWDPFYIEGISTLAFEIFEEYGVPDSVLVPVANGTLLLGLYWGFRALMDFGVIGRAPKIFGVQGEDFAPLYEEIHGSAARTHGSSLADGLRIACPPRRKEILNAIRTSGGDVFVVSDPGIREGIRRLLRMGIVAEPTSATALAALEEGGSALGRVILIPITGSGTKNLEGVSRALGL